MFLAVACGGDRCRYSAISLALFEDSGWYQVNYTRAGKLDWGYKMGCPFVQVSGALVPLDFPVLLLLPVVSSPQVPCGDALLLVVVVCVAMVVVMCVGA